MSITVLPAHFLPDTNSYTVRIIYQVCYILSPAHHNNALEIIYSPVRGWGGCIMMDIKTVHVNMNSNKFSDVSSLSI